MFGINRDEYTPAEQGRHEAAYHRLREMIRPGADAAEFRRGLEDELAAGFAIGFQDEDGWTLLHWAASNYNAIRAGLLQILIDAGAAVDIKDDKGRTPLSLACWGYILNGAAVYLTAIDTLFKACATPGLDEKWKTEYTAGADWPMPDQRARRDSLAVYIDARAVRRRAEDAAPGFDYAL